MLYYRSEILVWKRRVDCQYLGRYMIKLGLCFIVFSVFSLTSCVLTQPSAVPEKHAMHACQEECKKTMHACVAMCQNNYAHCDSKDKARAVQDYKHYLKERCVQGELALTRLLSSFRDPLICKHVTCDCCNDYEICKQACTGTIQKRLTATS